MRLSLSRTNNLSESETPTDTGLLIEAHLPRETQSKPVGVEQLLRQVREGLIELVGELGQIGNLKELLEKVLEVEMLRSTLLKSAHLLTSYEVIRRNPPRALQQALQLTQVALKHSKESSFQKTIDCLDRLMIPLNEVIRVLESEKPECLEIEVIISGNREDLGSLNESLRQEALKLIQSAQYEAAETNGWKVIKGADGELHRFKPPLGSRQGAVRPPQESDYKD